MQNTFIRIKALIKKEFLAIFKDPKNRALIIFPPIIQLFIFAHAITLEVRNIDISVLDYSNTQYSRELISRFHNSKWFRKIRNRNTISELKNDIDLKNSQLGIIIRSADGSKKGIDKDQFVNVTDMKYHGFVPGKVQKKSLPSGVQEGINLDIDNCTVTLVLYDKATDGSHKDYAYVVGDFNEWTLANDETSQMYRDEATGCWWITISDLDPAKEYRFQYYVGTLTGDVMRLADPYSEKILDPDNDKYIAASTYPVTERQYPDKGIGIVSVFKLQREEYSWINTDFKIKDADNLMIYEMLLRDFTESGDLNGAIQKLDYLQALGINAVELMPVQEFDGNNSWGYNPCFFFALDKAYGT